MSSDPLVLSNTFSKAKDRSYILRNTFITKKQEICTEFKIISFDTKLHAEVDRTVVFITDYKIATFKQALLLVKPSSL